ncbi:hypothetical protein EON67_10730 [archaeon]|nr:MAG: hypothetical protein EON67_10730 [archaeon]
MFNNSGYPRPPPAVRRALRGRARGALVACPVGCPRHGLQEPLCHRAAYVLLLEPGRARLACASCRPVAWSVARAGIRGPSHTRVYPRLPLYSPRGRRPSLSAASPRRACVLDQRARARARARACMFSCTCVYVLA